MTLHSAQLGHYLEDFVEGDVYQHPLGRTISEVDCTWFTLLTCNLNQNHFNADYARQNPVTDGRIIVNSGLTIALILGLSVIDMSQNAVANLSFNNLNMTHPVYLGDTLYAESLCTGVRDSKSRPGFGILTMKTRGLNQHGDTVMTWDRSVMVPRRSSGVGQNYFPNAKAGPIG